MKIRVEETIVIPNQSAAAKCIRKLRTEKDFGLSLASPYLLYVQGDKQEHVFEASTGDTMQQAGCGIVQTHTFKTAADFKKHRHHDSRKLTIW